jgi:hypothetical protein
MTYEEYARRFDAQNLTEAEWSELEATLTDAVREFAASKED